MSKEPNDIIRAAEIDKLISRANVHRLRGNYAEAEDAYREVLALDESRSDVIELIGDVLDARGQTEKAAEEYKKAIELDPKRASVETKYARMVLKIGEREYGKQLAREMLENPRKFAAPPRHPLLAFILSSLVPGFGQIYNGELTKGLILVGAFILSLLVLALSATETKNLLQVLGALVNPLAAQTKSPPVSGLVLWFAGALMFTYVYSIIDAPIAAAKGSRLEGCIRRK